LFLLITERIQTWNQEKKDIIDRIDDPIPVDTVVSLGLATPFDKLLASSSKLPYSDHDFSSNDFNESEDEEEYKDRPEKESIASDDEDSGQIYDSESYTAPQTAPHETFEDDGNKNNYIRRLTGHVRRLRELVCMEFDYLFLARR
jgi:hypothetical protein